MDAQRTRHLALFAGMCLIWGTTWIAMKVGVATIPPLLFAGARFTAAGLLFWTWDRLAGGGPSLARADLARLAAVALLLITLTYAALFWGAQRLPTGIEAVVNNALTPIALLGFAVASGQERLSAGRLAAMALGVGGLLLLFGPALHGGAEAAGIAATVVGTLAYCAGSVLARRLLRTYRATRVAAATHLSGGALLLALGAAFEPWPAGIGARAILAWAFLVVFGSLGGFTAYLILVRDWGASRAGSYAFISPIIAMLLGAALLHEGLGADELAGMTLMLGAALLIVRRA